MEILETIRSRRTIHLGYYADTPIPDELLEQVLDAGRWAPSAANNQPCHFVVVKDREARQWVVDHTLEVLLMSGKICRPPYREALRKYHHYLADLEIVAPPVMVITLAEQDKGETHVYNHGGTHTFAASAAIQNMMLAAWSLGLGAAWGTFFDDVRVKIRFGIPSELDVVGIIPFGFPVAVPRVPPALFGFGQRLRRPLEQIVHHDQFDDQKFEALRKSDPYLHWTPEEERQRLAEQENEFAREERNASKAE